MNLFYSSEGFEKAFTYTGNDLGAVWSLDNTRFRLWAPTASAVSLKLYRSGDPRADDLLSVISLTSAENGTWFCALDGDLHGVYYTWLVTREGETIEACDPYARAVGVNGRRAMVIDLSRTDPPGWKMDRDPHYHLPFTDAVICEAHVRDLTVNRHGRIHRKGKFLGVCESGTETTSGHPTGLNHLQSLGITHLHLLPVFDYSSVDEANTEIAQFNWGYDPENFNVPEGSFATDPYRGEVRVAEMKQMVSRLHTAGISVIMDVVYNHVHHVDSFCLNRIVPRYFSRFDENGRLTNACGCGNDTASERSMVRKYIVDSVSYWADEYHIDGFRFDLVGLIDADTIRQVMDSVHSRHPNVVFYGEGWDMAQGVTKPGLPMAVQKNAALLPGFAFFNDRFRDTLRGSVFDVRYPGFLTGAEVPAGDLAACFLGLPGWTEQPEQVINYISCHDNHTLYDRICAANPGFSREDAARRTRLGAAFTLLSQGIPFFMAGEEMLRSKPGRTGFLSNSYRSPDRVNAIRWETLNEPEVQKTVLYYRGLISLRRQYSLFRMMDRAAISEHCISVPCRNPNSAAFVMRDETVRIFVIFNGSNDPVYTSLPEGNWEIRVNEDRAASHPLGIMAGTAVAQPMSALVLVQPKGY